MKVLHINSYYAASGSPGFYKNLYEVQIRQGLDITVFVPVPYNLDPAKKKQFGEYSQVVKTHNPMDRFMFHVKHAKILKEARRRFSDGNFDIIHAHSLFSNGYVAWKLSKQLGIPYVVAVRNTDVNTFFRYMLHLKGTARKILRDAGHVLFINEPYREFVIEEHVPVDQKKEISDKTLVIPNGIDKFWQANKNQNKQKRTDRGLKLLTVGQINRNKNNLTVAKAAEILINRGYDVTYTIVGEQKDKKIFRALQKYPFVKYVPPKPKEELINYYRAADVFVLPSITETFGLVYPEAMTQGLPVIYSKGQGFDGQFAEGTVGYHVDSKNEVEIADRIIDITGNYETISRNCIQLSGKFDWWKIAGEYERVYKDCR